MITNGIVQLNDNSYTRWLRRRGLLTVAAVILVATLISLAGEHIQLALQYDRNAIHSGEFWRLITGHIVHGSQQHTFVNVLGVILMSALFHRTYSYRSWLIIVIIGLVTIDLGFWFLMPGLQWYVGLSGVLHAVLAAGAVAWWKTEPKPLAFLLTLIMVGKLIWEQTQGALPLSGELPVVVNAHMYGEIGGLCGGLLRLRDMSTSSSQRVLTS